MTFLTKPSVKGFVTSTGQLCPMSLKSDSRLYRSPLREK